MRCEQQSKMSGTSDRQLFISRVDTNTHEFTIDSPLTIDFICMPHQESRNKLF